MPRGTKSINRPPTPEPEDQSRELSVEEDIRLRVSLSLPFAQAVIGTPKFMAHVPLCLLCSSYKAALSKGECRGVATSR